MNGSLCFEDSFLGCETFGVVKTKSFEARKILYVRGESVVWRTNDLFCSETLLFSPGKEFFEP
jgi:hypothetical protein